MGIQSFKDEIAEEFFKSDTLKPKTPWSNIKNIVKRKLDMIDYASQLLDLKSPPGNKLEALKGDLVGFHSIRINDQWRVVFKWTSSGATEVRVVDYH